MLMQTDPLLGFDRFVQWPRTTVSDSSDAPISFVIKCEQLVPEFDSPAIEIDCGNAYEAVAA